MGAVALLWLGLPLLGGTGAQTPSAAARLLDLAADAERQRQFDTAIAHLYRLTLEQAGEPEAIAARLRLARLLALAGELSAALLQCQVARDTSSPDSLERRQAISLASVLTRRLRGDPRAPYYQTTEALSAPGLKLLDRPTAIAVGEGDQVLIVDDGEHRAYRLAGDKVTTVPGPRELGAAAWLPGGSLALAGDRGFAVGDGAKLSSFTWSSGGRNRELRKVRALAANSRGDLFVVDDDVEGLLRCEAKSPVCAPWGSTRKLLTVKVAADDLVYALDDRRRTVQVFDGAGQVLAEVGTTFGNARLDRIGDIAVDGAYGLFLLDDDQKRVQVAALRSSAGSAVSAVATGWVPIPADEQRGLNNPSAIGVTSDGALLVAGRSSSRVLKFR